MTDLLILRAISPFPYIVRVFSSTPISDGGRFNEEIRYLLSRNDVA